MKFLCFLLCLVSFSCSGMWVLGTNTSMVNITPNIKTENLSAYLHAYYTLSDGTPHVILGFDGDYAQAWDVNLSNGVSRVFTMTNDPPGTHGIPREQAIVTYSNTLLVTATAMIFSGLWEFNPATGTSTRIATNTGQLVTSIGRAPDGAIFMGTYGTVRVDEWNPSNRVFRTWGFADDDLVGSGNFAYYINASVGYIYTTIRDGNDWYLSIIDRATSNKTHWWKSPAGTALTVSDGVDGKVYADVITNGQHGYFILTNGTPASISALAYAAAPKYEAFFEEPGVQRDFDNWDVLVPDWNIEVNATAYSVDDSIPSTSIRWKPAAGSVWSSVIETNNWLPVATGLDIVQPWTGNSLLWVTRGYGPVGSFVPGSAASVIGAYKRNSLRDVLQVGTDVYGAGYHRETWRLDSTQPWTRTPSVQDFTDDSFNPYTIDELGGKWHVVMALANGILYTASHHDRGSSGGSMHWYDPSNGTKAATNFSTSTADTPCDLKPSESGSKLVWLSFGGNVFVWDTATFTIVTNFTLGIALKKCVEYESGKLFGITSSNMLGFTTSGTILWSNNLPASAWSTEPTAYTIHYDRVTLGPDNQIYQVAGVPPLAYLYRINPATGSYAVVRQTTNSYRVMFDGGTAYLYGNANTWAINNLLVPTLNTLTVTTLNIGL